MLTLLALGICFALIYRKIDNPAPIESITAPAAPETINQSGDNFETADSKLKKTIKIPAGSPASDRLVGQVVSPGGNGIAGITVRLRTMRRSDRGFFIRRTVTDSTGVFILEDIDPNGVYMLSTQAKAGYPGYRLDGFTLDSLSKPFKISLAPLELVEVSATVVDAEHAPIANFTLTVENLDHHYPSQTVTSDVSGYFRLAAFPAGKLKIYTASSDYYRILGLQAKTDHYRNLTLVIDHGRYKLEGQVLDPKGRPIESTRITLTSAIAGNEYLSQAFRTRYTDAMGRFEFSELSGVTQILGVYAIGYKPHIENYTFQNFSDELEIRLLQ